MLITPICVSCHGYCGYCLYPSLCFTVEAELTTFILPYLGELRCLERRWPLQGHLLGHGTSGQSPGPCILTKLSSWCWCFCFSADGLMPSLIIQLSNKGVKLAFGVLFPIPQKLSDCCQRRLWGWGSSELCASNSVIPWQSTGRVHGGRFPGANGSVYGTIKLTVFVCQNLMVFTQPGTNLPEMLLLFPYHMAPGTIGRSLIAQWYNIVHSEQLVGWWSSSLLPPLCSASFRTALAFGSGDNCSLGFLSPSLPSIKLRRIFQKSRSSHLWF